MNLHLDVISYYTELEAIEDDIIRLSTSMGEEKKIRTAMLKCINKIKSRREKFYNG